MPASRVFRLALFDATDRSAYHGQLVFWQYPPAQVELDPETEPLDPDGKPELLGEDKAVTAAIEMYNTFTRKTTIVRAEAPYTGPGDLGGGIA